jgi:cobalt/nickel transport system permease protein
MHIPDGYLGPATYGTMFGIMVPLWAIASKKVKQAVKAAQVPYLAMGAAFSLVIMMFVLPIPGGTTGHMSGATLIAILLGPWSALMAVSISLIIQALVMGDGGITAIGANCFNIAFIGSFVGFWIYTLITRTGEFAIAGKMRNSTERAAPSLLVRLFAAGAASYVALNLGALAAAVQLGIQPLLYDGSATGAFYFPYPLKYTLPAMMIPHLTMVGALEVTGTVLVLIFLKKTEVYMKGITKLTIFCLLATTILAASVAAAHDYWIEKKGSGYAVVYGHGEQRSDYDPTTVKRVTVFNSEGKSVEFWKEMQGKVLMIHPAGAAAMILADLDSGYWSKTIYGWKNLPRRKASRVVEAIRSYHYSKSIISWGEYVRKPIAGIKLDIVPQKNPFDFTAGELLPLKVYLGGKSLAGAAIEGDHEKVAVTDKDGMANVPLKRGRQLFTVERKEPIKGDPDADFMSVTTTLTFEVKK